MTRKLPLFWKSTYIGFGIVNGEYEGVQITVFTFHKPVSKRVLKNALLEVDKIEVLIKTKKEGYEKREVFAHEAKGLGFYYVNPLVNDKPVYAEPVRFNLEPPHLGLGQSVWMAYLRGLGKAFLRKVFKH